MNSRALAGYSPSQRATSSARASPGMRIRPTTSSSRPFPASRGQCSPAPPAALPASARPRTASASFAPRHHASQKRQVPYEAACSRELSGGLSHLEQEPGRLRQPNGGVEGCCRERLLAERSMAPSEQLSGAHL